MPVGDDGSKLPILLFASLKGVKYHVAQSQVDDESWRYPPVVLDVPSVVKSGQLRLRLPGKKRRTRKGSGEEVLKRRRITIKQLPAEEVESAAAVVKHRRVGFNVGEFAAES